jgi:ABC-type transporter Mla subunit MlaD
MSRRVGLLLLLVVVLLVGGAAAVVLSARPGLSDARDRVDAQWVPLRAPLAARYDQLGGLSKALAAVGAGTHAYATDLDRAVAEWSRLAAGADPDPAAEVDTANRLEGLAARVRANVGASAKLQADPGVTAAFAAYDSALVPPDAIRRYNRAVHAYQDARDGVVHRIAARLLRYDSRSALVIGVGSPG